MSADELDALLESKGSFPPGEEVRAIFDALFEHAARGEDPSDMAGAFLSGPDQMSNVRASIDPDVAERLYRWVTAHWSPSPPRLLGRLCALLVNVGSPESLAFLKQQRAAAEDEAARRALDDALQDHRITRAEATRARQGPA